MKAKLLLFLSFITLVLLSLLFIAFACSEMESTSISGMSACPTEENLNIINNASELQDINTTGDYCLNQDIDLANVTFTPIASISQPFAGSLDGNKRKIINLNIDNPSGTSVAFFAAIGTPGVVKNLTLQNVVINGGNSVAGLAGFNSGSIDAVRIENISITSSGNTVGGLVGSNASSIINSYSSGNITGDRDVGGLAGSSIYSSSITNSYSTASVSGSTDVGGFVGDNSGSASITNSYSTGNITGTTNAGKFVGNSSSSVDIVNSYFDTSATGGTDGVGNGSQTGVTGITSVNILSGGDEPFATVGWDFATIWKKQGGGQWPGLIW